MWFYGLHILQNFLNEYIKMIPYWKLNVRFTAQVLSSTASKFLVAYCQPEAAETAWFCSIMNPFFDIMILRNTQSHKFVWNPMLASFISINDWRFLWLRNVFWRFSKIGLILLNNAKKLYSRCLSENVHIVANVWRIENNC